MERDCDVCGVTYHAKRRTSRFCGDRCRKRSQRLGGVVRPLAGPSGHEVEDATRAALAQAGRLETVSGQLALLLARRLDDAGRETGTSLAAVAKQLQATLAVALEGAEQEVDLLEELRQRSQRRLRSIPGGAS